MGFWFKNESKLSAFVAVATAKGDDIYADGWLCISASKYTRIGSGAFTVGDSYFIMVLGIKQIDDSTNSTTFINFEWEKSMPLPDPTRMVTAKSSVTRAFGWFPDREKNVLLRRGQIGTSNEAMREMEGADKNWPTFRGLLSAKDHKYYDYSNYWCLWIRPVNGERLLDACVAVNFEISSDRSRISGSWWHAGLNTSPPSSEIETPNVP